MGKLFWSALLKLRDVAREKYLAYRKREMETAPTIPPDPAMPHHRHNFSWYAGWRPGHEPFERLKVPECAYCGAPQTERNRLARCDFFG